MSPSSSPGPDARAPGYSGKSLAAKLGAKPGHRMALLNAPAGFAIEGLPEGVTLLRSARAPLDLTLSFHDDRAGLARRLPQMIAATVDRGMIWVAWPKQASKVPTDITEDVVRDVALPLGLVDVKVCAVDSTWSGLKLVRRLP